jgi:hypothetical protein
MGLFHAPHRLMGAETVEQADIASPFCVHFIKSVPPPQKRRKYSDFLFKEFD